MSWMKRPRASPAPPSAAAPAPAPAPQPPISNLQQQWGQNQNNAMPLQPGYSPYGNLNTSHPPPQQSAYWQHQQQNSYGQNFPQGQQQQQPYNEYYQYNQQYTNPNSNAYIQPQTYDAYNQQGQHYNTPPAQPVQTLNPPNPLSQNIGDKEANEADSWGWGWDDSSTTDMQAAAKSNSNVNKNSNANVLGESFTNTADSWNFPLNENISLNQNQQNFNLSDASKMSSHNPLLYNDSSKVLNVRRESNSNVATLPVMSQDSSTPMESVQLVKNANLEREIGINNHPMISSNLNDSNKNMSMDQKADNFSNSGKTHLGNIPHKWSTESQPSQESSDGILSHTESSTGSEEPLKSFEKNSSGVNPNDNMNFNYAQQHMDKAYNQAQGHYLPGEIVNQELINSIKKINISSNVENVLSDRSIVSNVHNVESNNFSLDISEIPPSASTVHPVVDSPPPPPKTVNPTGSAPKNPGVLPPPASNQGANIMGSNPFKRVGQVGHKNATSQMKQSPNNTMFSSTNQQLIQDIPFSQDVNARQPSLSPSQDNDQNNQTNRIMHANLETTPDNSERPDNPSPVNYAPIHYPPQSTVENCEVAPNNDRNEYLQTGHLSESAFNENTNFADAARNNQNNLSGNYPPPGLRRMVLGQPESEFGQLSSFGMDEPPPGLSRMIPGQPTGLINIYNQPNDDYLDRQVDGQTTESDSLTNSACMARTPVYRQVDGQPTDDEINYNQGSRNSIDRRPVGFDRMVPGEASINNFNQTFQNQNFSGANEERVVTGFEQLSFSEPREQNMDGSDYSEVDNNQMRNIVGATEQTVDNRNSENSLGQIQSPSLETDLERDRNMEGENLQDITNISSTDFSMIRDQNMDGADTQEEPVLRNIDPADSESDRLANAKASIPSQHISSDKDRKFRDDTTGDESERDKMYKINAARKEKETSRLRSSRERDSRYGERRSDRRLEKDWRGADYHRTDRERASEDRKYRRNKDSRYDTEDTDYSDRDKRRYREGSYSSSKPPRPDDRSRRDDDGRRSYDRSAKDDRDKRRRDDRDRRDNYESERDTIGSRRRDKDRDFDSREDDRSRRYGNSERDRHYSNLRKERGRDDRKRGDLRDTRYRPPRPDSRDPDPAEDEAYEAGMEKEQRRDRRSRDERDDDRDPRSHRYRRDPRERGYGDQYYDRYGYSMDPYSQQMYQQHQTYQYYEKLRITNPQAYLEIYNKYMTSGHNLSQSDVNRALSSYGEGYTSLPGYDTINNSRLGDERGSVHSGRSSTNGEALKDRMVLDGSGGYFYPYRRIDNPSNYMKQDTPTRTRGDHGSIRTDYSGSRDFNTDASLNLYLEDSTIKSERLTPVKFATAHIKGMISSPNVVIINPSYPSDGQPAMVEILNINKLLSSDPICSELTSYPGPLIKGTTHKKTVIEFCETKIRAVTEKYSPLFAQERIVHSHHLSAINNSHPEKNTSSYLQLTELGSVVLMWELLILLLRQNGMVVGTDIAELLIKNKNQFAWKGAAQTTGRGHSRRDSASSATSRSADLPSEDTPTNPHGQENIVNQDVDHDSSNDISIGQSDSLSANNKRERKPSKDNSAASKPGRKTSSNFYLESSQQTQNSEKYVTDKFREYLLFGSGKDALEWAMSHGLWGHALFLASKLDRRTYANVMARFANGLSSNDPLQTLYQLMSGRQPASVTCVLDEKWGDWRPHLAMILSNASQRPELDKKSITILGDTLQSRGDLFAAQFCYLMARVEFGKRPTKIQASSGSMPRLVLLGSSPTNESFTQFASNEAIMMTEIYEYACSLADDNFVLVDFQVYKYLLATRLIDYGLYDRALFYMEKIAQVVSLTPARYELSFIEKVLQIADRLKHYDPEEHVGDIVDDLDQSVYDSGNQFDRQKPSNTEQQWISGLRQIINDMNTGNIGHSTTTLTNTATNHYYQPSQSQYNQHEQNQSWSQYQNYNQVQLQQQYNQQLEGDSQNQQYNLNQQFTDNSLVSPPSLEKSYEQTDGEKIEQPQVYDPNFSQNNSSLYSYGNVPYTEQDSMGYMHDNQKDENSDYKPPHSDSGYWNQDIQSQHTPQYGYNEPDVSKSKTLPDTTDNGPGEIMEQSRPQISMPNTINAHKNRSMYEDDQENMANVSHNAQPTAKPKDKPKKDDKSQASTGWFGGIFNKLSLKPKNQMILPDDKNPSIVWDPEKKKWMNLDADETEQESKLAPPPKMPDIMRPAAGLPNQNQMATTNQPAFAPPTELGAPSPVSPGNTPNIFKLQKGRHIKKSYVDVFNPSGAPIRPLPPASEVLGAPQTMTTPTSYFVPQSSADGAGHLTQTAPSFYNPSDYSSG